MSDNEDNTNNDAIMKEETDKSNQDTAAQVASAQSIRLSPFWADNPRVWFITTEVQFAIHKVTRDEAKYGQIILALTQDQCGTVLDLLEDPPQTNKYETLKAALIERNSLSEERKLESLLDRSDIGDKRPSEILRQIRCLAGPQFNPRMIKSLWMRKLPEYIRLALIPQGDDKTADELVKTADKLNEALSAANVSSVGRQSRPTNRQDCPPPSTIESTLEDRIKRMEGMLTKLTSEVRARSSSRGFSSRYRSNSRNRNNKQDVCWYHRKFGAQAQKCAKPCTFGSGSSAMQIDQSTPNM